MFKTRYYNKINLDPQKGVIIKTSNTERFDNEISYYKSIPHDLRIFFPRLIDVSLEIDGGQSAEFEYFPYNTLDKFYASTLNEWKIIASQIKYILNKFAEQKPLGNYPYEQSRKEMYIDKTINECTSLIKNNKFFSDLEKTKKLWINGAEYDNFLVIWDRIKQIIEKELIEKAPEACMVHGDCCMNNILVHIHKNQAYIRMIDPRGSWGPKGLWGDLRYDWAKLYHSFDGKYELIVNDQYTLYNEGNKFVYAFPHDFNNAKQAIEEVMPQNVSQLECKLIQATIYIGMVQRHKDSIDRQKIMYCTGIKMLNEVLSEYERTA